MEIRLTGGRVRMVQTPAEQEEQTVQSPKAQQAAPKTDRLSLSQQGAAFLREWNQAVQEEAMRAAEQKQGDDGTLELLQKAIKAMKQCAEIARRIQAGDKVPPEDEQFLMNNDPAGYKLAMAMREVKKDPKKWDSVLDKEDTDNTQDDSESSEASGVSEVSSSGPADSGGSAASSF